MLSFLLFAILPFTPQSPEQGQIIINAPFVRTPPDVIDAMMKIARVGRRDTVYDLGSGDGRIVIAAARKFRARAVGVENDAGLVGMAQKNARKAGVSRLVEFRRQDLFEADLSKATVVMFYLLPEQTFALRNKLARELRAGTRIVSHAFHMGPEWKPDKEIEVRGAKIYYWVVPAKPRLG